MSIIKKLFGGGSEKTKVEVQPMRGFEPIQSDAERSATREKMEAELQADKGRRAAPSENAPR